MLEPLEGILFHSTATLYALSWVLFLTGWRRGSDTSVQRANGVLWVGFGVHTVMEGLRAYRAGHVPIITAWEFVTAMAFLVVGVFLLFALKKKNRPMGVYLLPVALGMMAYAALLNRALQPEFPIFDGLLLQVHVLTTMIGYAAWAITFAASVAFLQISRRPDGNPRMFDQMAYRAAFFAFCFLTLGIVTGSLWSDRVFGQLWFWDPKETWSLITWLIFLAYLHARYTLDWRGRRAAVLAIIGFLAVLFTYVGVDFLLPHLHGSRT